MAGNGSRARTEAAAEERRVLASRIADRLRVARRLVPVADTRTRGKTDLPLNDAMPDIRIEPDTFAVHIDGELIVEAPAVELPMAQRYFLF